MLVITTHIIPMFIALALGQGATNPSRYQGQAKRSELVIELDKCRPATFSFPRALGSESILVKGRRKSRCVLRYTREVEGGYVESECRVPSSVVTLSLSGGNAYLDRRVSPFTKDVSKYCRVVKQGNIFFDQIKTAGPQP